MKKVLSSRVVKRSLAILLSISMLITLMPTSLNARAADTDVSVTAASGTDMALQATASASGEHSDWGILATNLNNGHTPASSSDPGGSWHDYGLNETDTTSWVQYDWDKDVTVDSMSIYWMCDGIWGDRIPMSIKIEYLDGDGNWQTAAAYDATVMAVQVEDQYNRLAFDQEVTTKSIRMTMERNADNFCSIHRWQVWGEYTPVDVALKGTASASGEHSDWGILADNLNNGHTPASSDDPAGSWHDYGLNETDTTSWVQYDWNADVTVDSMSIYWMCDGVWEDRIPKGIKVEYLDAGGSWQTAATYDAAVMAAQVKDQYNKLSFDSAVTTRSIRMTMERNTDNFCSIHRWQVWGQIAEEPLSDAPVITKTADGYKMVNKYFVVETGKYGQITSLQLQGDEYPTNYVMNAKNSSSQNTDGHQWLGELMFSVKVGDAEVYTEENTSRSTSGRTVELKEDKVVVTYEGATEEKGIKDFKVVETYSLVGDKLHWEITVINTNTEKLTIGDFGLPLPFNERWPGGEEIYETRTVDHSFVGKQSSYVYVTRPSGLGKFLLMTPDTLTGAGFEYVDHWKTVERSADEAAWCQDQAGWASGLSVFYLHSDYIKKTSRGYLGNTALELAPGESKTYAFNFSGVDDETDMKSTLYQEGVIDAVAVPGMAYSINMPGKFYLHTSLSKDDISINIQCPHETGLYQDQANSVNSLLPCKKTAENTYATYENTVILDGEQYHVYSVHFGDLGQNNVVITYNGGKSQTVLQFYMMDDVATALTTHSEFMVDNTQFDDPLDISDKIFDDWMMDTKNRRAETDSTYWQKNYWGWGDDWALTHGEYIAEKNVYQPVAKEIKAVDEYLDIAIWNGLMREHQKDYLIHDFLMESPNSSPTYRGYAYPHIYNTFFSMYKIASKYPDMIEYTEAADTYLLRAYHILVALYGSSVSYNWSTGLMGELTTPDIIAALVKEGYYTEAQAVVDIMLEKYKNFKDTKYPYGSEYSYDNTGEEAVYTLAKMNLETDTANALTMMKKIDLKTRACRGLQPIWYYYANPTTICGDSWWQFQYTAALAGYCMDDWLRLQDNGLTDTQRATASRVNYAAKLANLTCINSGQIDADPENIGAVAWTYQAELGNNGADGTGGGKQHNGWRQMSGESDLGLFGALQILSSDVAIDPVFGLFGYGCNVTESSGIYTVTPLDGLFTRLNFINQKLYIELDRDQYTEAKVSADSNLIELSMKNLEGTAHNTDVNITGLKAGSYQISVDGSIIGSFQAVDGKTSTVTLVLPAAATAQVSITAGTAPENKAPTVTLADSRTVAISDQVRLEAKATDDGYVNSTLGFQWEVVSTPEEGTATLGADTKLITDVTFSKVGDYVFRLTADDGGLTTSKEIAVTVTEDAALPEVIAAYTFEADTVVGINKLLVNSTTGSLQAELDDNSALVEGKTGNGVKFTGSISGGYIELPEALTKRLTEATITTDVKLSENQSNFTTLFELGSNVVVEFVDGNILSLTVNGKKVSTGVEFAPGYWMNVELTANGDDYALYINGVKKAELTDTGLSLADIDTEAERYLIGRSKAEADPFLKGTVDNFIVKSVVMTEEELKAAYGAESHTLVSAKGGSVITKAGEAPTLPTQVSALYSDGVYEKYDVVWEKISPASYAAAGTFTVDGKLKDTDITVTYKVIVVKGTLQNVAAEAEPSAIYNNPSDLGGVKGLNDGFDPTNSADTSHGVWHNWGGNNGAAAWVQYDWAQEQVVAGTDIYFFKDGNGNFAPASYSIEYLNEDGSWYSVTNASGLGINLNQYNHTSFDPVITKGIRVTINPATQGSGVIEWKVYGYKDGAVIDKAQLNIAIATAEGLSSSLFSAGMEAVTTALAAAKTVAADKNATQAAIDAATSDLNDAIFSLTPVLENNIAYFASVSASYTSSWENLSAVNDGAISSVSNSGECKHWGTWGNKDAATESVTYSWGAPIRINSADLYLWNDGGGIKTPVEYVYEYKDEEGNWKEVTNASGYQINLDGFNTTTFDAVVTTALRVTLIKESAEGDDGVGLVEWRVFGTKLPKAADVTVTTNPSNTSAVPNSSKVKVTLGSELEDAVIYYTTDGSKPSTNSTKYTGEFEVSTSNRLGETLVIKAIQVAAGYTNSNVAEKVIKFLPAETTTPTNPTTPETPATPTPVPATPTPVVETVPGTADKAASTLTVTTGKDAVDISVTLDDKQLKKQLEEAASGKLVEVPIITADLIDRIIGNGSDKVDISVMLPKEVVEGGNLDRANIKLPEELLTAAKENGIDIKVSVKDDTGKELYTWSFNGNNLAASQREVTDVNLALSVARVSDQTQIEKALTTADKASEGLVISFNHAGVLPAQASVRIYVGDLAEQGSSIFLYYFNQETGKLETLPYSSSYRVDAEGYITINLIHCSDYVVLTKPASKEAITSLLNQVKVTASQKTLYVGGTKDTQAQLTVSVPSTLEIVGSFKDKTSGSAVGAVTVAYASSNDKVATVDSKGRITAVAAGTATIVTTIKLYSGKSASIKTKITVKEAFIKFTKSKSSMKVGDTFTFKIEAKGLDLKDIVWKTTKKSVVVIDKNGKATAVSKGTDYVVVSIGNVTKKIKVVVK